MEYLLVAKELSLKHRLEGLHCLVCLHLANNQGQRLQYFGGPMGRRLKKSIIDMAANGGRGSRFNLLSATKIFFL